MKTILVPIDSEGRDLALLETTLALAGRFRAHVEVLHIRRDPEEMLHATGMALPGSMRKSVLEVGVRQADEGAYRARALFDEACATAGVNQVEAPPFPDEASVVWRDRTGKPSLLIALRGRLADLIVVSRPADDPRDTEILEAALLETGRPVLIVPPGDAPKSVGKRIAIGWNGSTVAAKAVMAAAPFLAEAEAITILTTGEARHDQLSARDLQRHLAWHGMNAEITSFKEKAGKISGPMLAEAHAFGADLLLLGGYGTSLTRNVILGGVTRAMLEVSDLPLLMAH